MEENKVLGRIGYAQGSDGALQALRMGKTAELVTGNLHGWYYEQTSRGGLFIASTAAAGVAPGTASSTTPPMAVWNPPNSGVFVSLQRVFVGYVSGTLGAGSMVHGLTIGQTTVPSAGTELTPQCGLLSNVRGKARAFQGSTLVAAPTIVRPSMILGAGLATTATFPATAVDEVGASIIIPPGSVWAYHGVAAAGTSPLVLIGAEYEEIVIP